MMLESHTMAGLPLTEEVDPMGIFPAGEGSSTGDAAGKRRRKSTTQAASSKPGSGSEDSETSDSGEDEDDDSEEDGDSSAESGDSDSADSDDSDAAPPAKRRTSTASRGSGSKPRTSRSRRNSDSAVGTPTSSTAPAAPTVLRRSWQRCAKCQHKHWSDAPCPDLDSLAQNVEVDPVKRRSGEQGLIQAAITAIPKRWGGATTSNLLERLKATIARREALGDTPDEEALVGPNSHLLKPRIDTSAVDVTDQPYGPDLVRRAYRVVASKVGYVLEVRGKVDWPMMCQCG